VRLFSLLPTTHSAYAEERLSSSKARLEARAWSFETLFRQAQPLLRMSGSSFWVVALVLLSLPALAHAEPPIITSAAPDKVSVTFYRSPDRDGDDEIDPDDLRGMVMISETRIVDIPAGQATIRFEGVASGIIPQSAIVTGATVGEKNEDRRLMSERGLLDAFTGQRVTIRRTDKATGIATTEVGTIRSDPDRLILQTRDGFEALHCTGLKETLLFPNTPRGLTAKPTLSILTKAGGRAGRQQVTLIYLARNFDWQANYVGEIEADGQTLALSATLTMASADATSFVNAEVFAVGGTVFKAQPRRIDEDGDGEYDYEEDEDEEEDDDPYSEDNIDISYNCWPQGTTGSGVSFSALAPPNTPAPMSLRFAGYYEGDAEGEIIVTASRAQASIEDLGDLKLYRVPYPSTVAANSQKQVYFLDQPAVKGQLIYKSEVNYDGGYVDDPKRTLRLINTKASGLGVALPGGQVTLYQKTGDRRSLILQTSIKDKTLEEEIDLDFDQDGDIDADVDEIKEGKRSNRYKLTLTNDGEQTQSAEIEFPGNSDFRFSGFSEELTRKRGKLIWMVTLKPDEKVSLTYTARDIIRRDEDD
jgi:hypothetical protein